MIYGYVRVSSVTQNIDRQMEEMKKIGLEKKQIYIDIQSGKDFNREKYQRLKKKFQPNSIRCLMVFVAWEISELTWKKM